MITFADITIRNRDVYCFFFGLTSGLTFSNNFNDLVMLITSVNIIYLTAMLTFRFLICWIVHDSFALNCAKRYGLTLGNINMEYNVWKNVMTIRRDMKGRLVTSSDEIDLNCKRLFYRYLFWDILYMIHPVKIIYV
jgi:hypothetical protein